jgi:hypothetical protein
MNAFCSHFFILRVFVCEVALAFVQQKKSKKNLQARRICEQIFFNLFSRSAPSACTKFMKKAFGAES